MYYMENLYPIFPFEACRCDVRICDEVNSSYHDFMDYLGRISIEDFILVINAKEVITGYIRARTLTLDNNIVIRREY